MKESNDAAAQYVSVKFKREDDDSNGNPTYALKLQIFQLTPGTVFDTVSDKHVQTLPVLKTRLPAYNMNKDYKSYRDFNEELNKLSLHNNKLNMASEFPKSRKAYLIESKLSESEQRERTKLLDGWIRELLCKYNTFDEEVKVNYFYFFCCCNYYKDAIF